MMFLTISVPILGALMVSAVSDLDLLLLAGLGVCAHIFGFLLNDFIDYDIDRLSTPGRTSPLIRQQFSRSQIGMMATGALPLALLIYFGLLGAQSVPAVFALGGSVCLSIVYNLTSKTGRFPKLLSEIALATSIGLLCLCGVLAFRSSIPAHVWHFVFNLTLGLLLLNSVPNHLKDIKNDFVAGAKSFPIWMGAHINHAGHIMIPFGVKCYAVLLQFMIVGGYLSYIWLYSFSIWRLGVAFFLILLGTAHLHAILNLSSVAHIRNARPLLSGYYHFAALLFAAWLSLPLPIQAALILITLRLVIVPVSIIFRVWQFPYQVSYDKP